MPGRYHSNWHHTLDPSPRDSAGRRVACVVAGPMPMIRFRWTLLLALSVAIMHPGSVFGMEAGTNDPPTQARVRVIIDNDFGGDPDGLFQLAHHLLSPSVEIRGIIGSHHYPKGLCGNPGAPENACAAANELLALMRVAGKTPVYQGAGGRIEKDLAPVSSDAARHIVREAMEGNAGTPLYITCGGGLTDLASAYLMEPKIAERVRLVWIGGHEHEGIAIPPPGGQRIEYNMGIDLRAAQVVFNQSEIPIWQVPRDTYRQALVSCAEMSHRMNGEGKLAGFLNNRLQEFMTRAFDSRVETYVMGDSPLVLLTALQSPWEADPSSCQYTNLPTPKITDQGSYEKNPQGRPMRVYTHLDTRLMFEDFYAKIARFDQRSNAGK